MTPGYIYPAAGSYYMPSGTTGFYHYANTYTPYGGYYFPSWYAYPGYYRSWLDR